MRTILSFGLLILATGTAFAAQCDCTIYPFRPDPPCVQQCSAKILASSSYGSLTGILRLSPDLAQRLSSIPSSQKPDELAAYAKFLPKSQVDTLDARFRSLSQDEFRRLLKSGGSDIEQAPK